MSAALFTLLLLAPVGLDEDPRVQEAQQLYRDVEFERATISFQEAALDPALSDEERAVVMVWIGMCRAQLGDFESAGNAIDQAVLLDPKVAPPRAAPPRVKEMLEQARASAAKTAAAAPEPEPEAPAEVESVPEPTSDEGGGGGDVLGTVGWVAAGAGGLALVGAAVLAGLGVGNTVVAFDEGTFQADAKSAADLANVEYAAAGVTAVVGLAVIGVGAAMVVLSGDE